MIIEKRWSMPSKNTFSIKPIRELLEFEFKTKFIDPFPYPYQKDALEYLQTFESESVSELAFDPPYSQRQLKEVYDNSGLSLDVMNCSYWSKLKKEISRVIQYNGKVISFGWNSGGIGKSLGFEQTRILLVSHGGMHNDTICTVEIKLKRGL